MSVTTHVGVVSVLHRSSPKLYFHHNFSNLSIWKLNNSFILTDGNVLLNIRHQLYFHFTAIVQRNSEDPPIVLRYTILVQNIVK